MKIQFVPMEDFDQASYETVLHLLSGMKDATLNIALSGGSTPIQLYRLIAQNLSKQLATKHFEYYQVDERWVDPNSDRSNQRMIRATILQDKSPRVVFHPIPLSPTSLEDAVENYSTMIDKVSLHLAIMGMGSDGHTASIFPNNPVIAQLPSPPPSVFSLFEPTQNETRISLSTEVIVNSSRILLLIKGFQKGKFLRQAEISGNPVEFPISAILGKNCLITFDADAMAGYDSV